MEKGAWEGPEYPLPSPQDRARGGGIQCSPPPPPLQPASSPTHPIPAPKRVPLSVCGVCVCVHLSPPHSSSAKSLLEKVGTLGLVAADPESSLLPSESSLKRASCYSSTWCVRAPHLESFSLPPFNPPGVIPAPPPKHPPAPVPVPPRAPALLARGIRPHLATAGPPLGKTFTHQSDGRVQHHRRRHDHHSLDQFLHVAISRWKYASESNNGPSSRQLFGPYHALLQAGPPISPFHTYLFPVKVSQSRLETGS